MKDTFEIFIEEFQNLMNETSLDILQEQWDMIRKSSNGLGPTVGDIIDSLEDNEKN